MADGPAEFCPGAEDGIDMDRVIVAAQRREAIKIVLFEYSLDGNSLSDAHLFTCCCGQAQGLPLRVPGVKTAGLIDKLLSQFSFQDLASGRAWQDVHKGGRLGDLVTG